MQSNPRISLLTTTVAEASLVVSRYNIYVVASVFFIIRVLSIYVNSVFLQPRQSESHTKASKMSPPPREDDESGEDEEDDEQGAVCGACGDNYDDFWISCDACEKWFHGKCVKITPAKAEHIKHYKCPTCSTNKKMRA